MKECLIFASVHEIFENPLDCLVNIAQVQTWDTFYHRTFFRNYHGRKKQKREFHFLDSSSLSSLLSFLSISYLHRRQKEEEKTSYISVVFIHREQTLSKSSTV